MLSPIDLARSPRALRPLDRDRLMMTPREAAAVAAMSALNPMQDMTPEQMVLGASVLFAALCARCRLSPAEMHAVAMKIITAPEDGDRATDANIQVLRDFAGACIMGQEVTFG